jgi:hypothetical protein
VNRGSGKGRAPEHTEEVGISSDPQENTVNRGSCSSGSGGGSGRDGRIKGFVPQRGKPYATAVEKDCVTGTLTTLTPNHRVLSSSKSAQFTEVTPLNLKREIRKKNNRAAKGVHRLVRTTTPLNLKREIRKKNRRAAKGVHRLVRTTEPSDPPREVSDLSASVHYEDTPKPNRPTELQEWRERQIHRRPTKLQRWRHRWRIL